MLKAVSLLLAGAIVGALLTVFWTGQGLTDSQSNMGSATRSGAVATQGRRDTAPARSVSDQLATLQAAQRRTSEEDLVKALETLLRDPWSATRELEADALLMRLSEISPGAAAETALGLEMSPNLVAQAFLAWAANQPEAALAALGSIRSPVIRNEVAFALLDVVGDDDRGVDRVAAALPQGTGDSFRVEWLAARAETNPYEAFRAASSMHPTSLRQRALTSVGTAWARIDPRGAMLQADSLSADQAQNFRLAVTREWARLNASDFLSYVETAPTIPEEFVVALRSVAVGDPERMLQLADRLPGQISDNLKASAISELAQTDLDRAESYALALPAGQLRNQTLAAVGGVLAREDPEAALRWAQEVAPGVRDVMTNIALTIASTDVDMAIGFLDNPPPGLETQLLISIISSRVMQNPDNAEEVAGRFLARDDLQSKAALSQLVSNWMQTEPSDALDWVLRNNAALDTRIMSTAAQRLANQDVDTAVDYIERIPQEHRGSWITQIAGQYGRSNPSAALGWVAQYQGESYYESALRQVLQSAAQTDPRTAAQQVAQASETIQLGAASQVASAWAQQEPLAAVEWASELSNDEARAQAVASAVGSWANSDPEGAGDWALTQPRGTDRDTMLRNLVYRSMNSGRMDQDLLDGFSSELTKQQTLQPVIPQIATTNPDLARELLENEISDPRMRRSIEQAMEAQTGQNSGVVVRF